MCAFEMAIVFLVTASLRQQTIRNDKGKGELIGAAGLENARRGIAFDGLAQFEEGLVGATLAGDGGSFDGCSRCACFISINCIG